MSIIEHAVSTAQEMGGSVMDVLNILVPVADVLFGLFFLFQVGILLRGWYAVHQADPYDLKTVGSEENDILTCIAVDLDIADTLVGVHDELKAELPEGEKVKKEDLLRETASDIRWRDTWAYLRACLVFVPAGLIFETYMCVTVVAIQAIVLSFAYEKLVPIVYEYRKYLNPDLFDGEEG